MISCLLDTNPIADTNNMNLCVCVPTPCYRLPHLTFLSIDDEVKASRVIGPTPDAAWDAAELTRLVSCCPNLSTLHAISLLPGAHVSVLSQLTGLTFLRVWYGLPADREIDLVSPPTAVVCTACCW